MKKFEKLQTRQVEMIVSVDGEGIITGIANRLGDIDSFSTIADPESVTPQMIERWVKRGAFLGSHEARKTPIGYLIEAGIKNRRDLSFTAKYHTTARAQEFRTVASERLAAEKTVGFSLGFAVSNYEYFPTGKRFLEIMAQRGRDLTLFNIEQISAHDDELWLMRLEELGEVSQVNFASNEASEALMIRAAELGDEEPKERPNAERETEISAKFDQHDQALKRGEPSARNRFKMARFGR